MCLVTVLCVFLLNSNSAQSSPQAEFTEDAFASEAETQDTVSDPFEKVGRYPWYDRESKSIKPVTLPVKEKPPQPSNWEAQQAQPSNMNWDWLWQFFQVLAWVGLICLFVLLAFLIIRNMSYEAKRKTDQNSISEEISEADRIAQLPFPVKKQAIGDLLSAAKACYEQGDFDQAIVFLFSHQLVQLDKAHLIRLTKGKTNRQYLMEIKKRPKLRSILSQTTIMFEDVFFGSRQLSQQRFELCWNQLHSFDTLIGENSK